MINERNSEISGSDRLGALAVRLGISRNNYAVEPGLYSLNRAQSDSPVFVTANYKLTFDKLRNHLKGISCFILALDTKGINVWCAAGKGTFGTEELIEKIYRTELKSFLTHQNIILPQLGAPGIEAHRVKKETGFTVIYGPVEARDIPDFLNQGMIKNDTMRFKSFPLAERVVLLPLELLQSWKVFLPVLVLTFIFGGLTQGWNQLGVSLVMPALTGLISGSLLTPLFLPVLPFRAFAAKGVVMGVLSGAIWAYLLTPPPALLITGFGWIIVLSSYLALYFTGASTYTSLSGVKKEMAVAVPLQITIAVLAPVVSLILFYTGVIA